MNKINNPLEDALNRLQYETSPTNEQKEKMLQQILAESQLHGDSFLAKAGGWIVVYPWRFAFSAAAAQAAIFTLIYGTKYTNLFLVMFGG